MLADVFVIGVWLQCHSHHPQSARFSKITVNARKSDLSPCSNQIATDYVTKRAVHQVKEPPGLPIGKKTG